MYKKTDYYFQFLRDILRNDGCFEESWKDIDWQDFYNFADKQAIVGTVFEGMQMLGEKIKGQMELDDFLNWFATSEEINQQNHIVNRRSVEVTKLFSDAGFRSCILKGQGNALMYPNPFSRSSGDIDLWVEGPRKKIHDFVVSNYSDVQDGDMHIEVPFFDDVIVDVHYFPRYSSVTKYNKRLQAWFIENSEAQFSNKVKLSAESEDYVSVPTAQFNAVQQMSHIMGHFFVEGIGLRQFVDYFYVLKTLYKDKSSEDYNVLFEYLGMLKFARGVMWVEKEILGLSKKYLLTTTDEIIGRTILKEIEEGGNFGHHDQRYAARNKGFLMRGIVDSYRLLKLACYFPEDALWKILRKVENQKWRLKRT